MRICSICHKVSATGQDHLDCVQKRSMEMEDVDFKDGIPEKISLSNAGDLRVELKAILEYLAKEKAD